MKITLAPLLLLILTGCSASIAEKDQQDFFEVEAHKHLKLNMTQKEILSWAEQHELGGASDGSGDIILISPRVKTRWPHIPCGETFTQIRIKLNETKGLASYNLGRGGLCL